VLEDGQVTVRGAADKGLPLRAVARAAVGRGLPVSEAPGLEATSYFKAPKMAYTNGVHVAAVEVDAETGRVRIERYAIAHDCGRMINPTIVEGQILGGLGCGIGNALLEENCYDEAGQLLSSTFMDYAMPTAADVPAPAIAHQETPTPLNPLGIKGAGESGTIPVPAVLASAIEDALAPLGVRLQEAPITARRLREAIVRAKGQASARAEGRADVPARSDSHTGGRA
jgi:carbon-monoxide dehydrogenase large subunit